MNLDIVYFMSLKLNPCLLELSRAFKRNPNKHCRNVNWDQNTKIYLKRSNWPKIGPKCTKMHQKLGKN